jgi:hypothetical protein
MSRWFKWFANLVPHHAIPINILVDPDEAFLVVVHLYLMV